MKKLLIALLVFGALAAAGGLSLGYLSRREATVPIEKTDGPDPVLVEPKVELVPSVAVAEATPWPAGMMPSAAPGLAAKEFAGGFDHPRWLHVLPHGDVLVAESNAPPQPDPGFSVRALLLSSSRAGPAPEVRAPIAYRCCATRTVTAWRKRKRPSSPGSIHRSV